MSDTLHIYTRVSTTSQEDGGSLKSQKDSGIKKSKNLGMKFKVWNEGGKSSSSDDLLNRPVLRELLELVETGEVKHLFVWNTDRLSRNEQTWTVIKYQFLIKHDVTLHTPTGQFDLSDPMSKMIMGVMGSISQYDNELRTIRLTEGKVRKVKEGYWKGGPPPYGYSLEDSKLVINEEEGKWVKFIYELYRDGSSVDDIRTQLLQNGVPTKRGNPVWSHRSIEILLTNTYFGGYWTMTPKGEKTIKVSCPKLLDSKLIKEVQDRRKERSYKRVGTKRTSQNIKHEYLVKDLLLCGHCGSRFSGKGRTDRSGHYECQSKIGDWKKRGTGKEKGCDGKRRLRINTTDELVWNTVVDVVTDSSLFKESIKSEFVTTPLVLDPKTRRGLDNKVKKLRKESEDVETSIVKLSTSLIIDKKDKDRTQSIIDNLEEHKLKIETEIEGIEGRLNQSETNKEWIDWVGHFGKKIDQLRSDDFPFEERKKFVEGLVHLITVNNIDIQTHELSIDFKLPYVGDRLKWIDENKKSKGYKITGGRKTKKVRSTLSKKSTT